MRESMRKREKEFYGDDIPDGADEQGINATIMEQPEDQETDDTINKQAEIKQNNKVQKKKKDLA